MVSGQVQRRPVSGRDEHNLCHGYVWFAGAGSNEIRSRSPVAAASRSRVRVDGFTLPLSRRAITALRRLHALGQVLLRETGTGARLDYRRRKRKLLLNGIVGLFVFGVLAPGGEGLLHRDHLPAHLTSSARRRASSILRRGVIWVFFVNTRRITTPYFARRTV
jgi:hypothetical protein